MSTVVGAVEYSEPSELKLLIIVFGAGVVAALTAYAMPLLVPSLMGGLGISESSAAFILSAELIGVALGNIAIVPFVGQIPRARVAVTMCFLAALFHVGSAYAPSVNLAMVAGLLAGSCAGIVGGIGTAVVAISRDPERLFAKVTIATAATGAMLVAVLPQVLGRFSFLGGFLVLAVITALLLPILSSTPNMPTDDATYHGIRNAPNRSIALVALVALLVLQIGLGAIYSVLGLIGAETGLSIEQVGTVFSLAIAGGLAGGFLAVLIGTRFGLMRPIAAGISLNALAVYAITTTTSPVIFTIGNLLEAGSFFFIVPYVIGLMASLDSAGRWAAAGSATIAMGAGVGPAIGGVLAERYGFQSIGLLAVGLAVTSVLCFAYANSTLQRRIPNLKGDPDGHTKYET